MKYKLFKKFIERILEHMEISHADLFEKSRKKSVVEARQLLYYVCFKRDDHLFSVPTFHRFSFGAPTCTIK